MRQHAPAYVSMRQHTSAYVRIRQHTSAYVSSIPAAVAGIKALEHREEGEGARRRERAQRFAARCCRRRCTHALHRAPEAAAYVSIRQHTSAYVSIRQHTCAALRSALLAQLRARAAPAQLSTSMRQHTSACVSIRQHTSAYAPEVARTPNLLLLQQVRTHALHDASCSVAGVRAP
jgi:hypothetical protein